MCSCHLYYNLLCIFIQVRWHNSRYFGIICVVLQQNMYAEHPVFLIPLDISAIFIYCMFNAFHADSMQIAIGFISNKTRVILQH